MEGEKGQKKVIKAVDKTEKLVKKSGKQVTKDMQKFARDYGKDMVKEMNTAIAGKKTESDAYL